MKIILTASELFTFTSTYRTIQMWASIGIRMSVFKNNYVIDCLLYVADLRGSIVQFPQFKKKEGSITERW